MVTCLCVGLRNIKNTSAYSLLFGKEKSEDKCVWNVPLNEADVCVPATKQDFNGWDIRILNTLFPHTSNSLSNKTGH